MGEFNTYEVTIVTRARMCDSHRSYVASLRKTAEEVLRKRGAGTGQ